MEFKFFSYPGHPLQRAKNYRPVFLFLFFFLLNQVVILEIKLLTENKGKVAKWCSNIIWTCLICMSVYHMCIDTKYGWQKDIESNLLYTMLIHKAFFVFSKVKSRVFKLLFKFSRYYSFSQYKLKTWYNIHISLPDKNTIFWLF